MTTAEDMLWSLQQGGRKLEQYVITGWGHCLGGSPAMIAQAPGSAMEEAVAQEAVCVSTNFLEDCA